MGWLYTHKEKSLSVKEFFKDRFKGENENEKGEVIDCKIVKLRTAYIAYKTTNKATGEFKITAVVCLLDYSKSYHNFGYKDMDESASPYFYDCPESILKQLTPTDSENANYWRNACREKREKTHTMKKNYDFLKKTLKEGDIIYSKSGKEYEFDCTLGKDIVAYLQETRRMLFRIPAKIINFQKTIALLEEEKSLDTEMISV